MPHSKGDCKRCDNDAFNVEFDKGTRAAFDVSNYFSIVQKYNEKTPDRYETCSKGDDKMNHIDF